MTKYSNQPAISYEVKKMIGVKMREINADGNVEALRRYEAHIDKEEKAYESYLAEIEDNLGDMMDEMIDAHRSISEKYGFEDKLVNFINER